MQEKNHTISEFIRRTDCLADSYGGNISQVYEIIGISKAMFFGYRSGKYSITSKVWRKLELAERATDAATKAEIFAAQKLLRAEQLSQESDKSDKTSTNVQASAHENQLHVELISQLAALTTAITEQNKRIDALLEQRAASARQAEATSSSSRGSSSREKTKTTTPKKLA